MTRRPCTNTEPTRLADALREIDRLRAENEVLRKLLKEWREHADYGGVPSEECLDATDATLYREGEK